MLDRTLSSLRSSQGQPVSQTVQNILLVGNCESRESSDMFLQSAHPKIIFDPESHFVVLHHFLAVIFMLENTFEELDVESVLVYIL